MKDNRPKIIVQITSLDNGFIIKEKGIEFAFSDWEEVSQWLEDALDDEENKNRKRLEMKSKK